LQEVFSNLNNIANYLDIKSPLDIVRTIVDIGIVSYVIYKGILLVRETRARLLIKGFAVILIAYYLSDLLKLKTIAYIFQNTFQLLSLALVVIFQPELRRGLEQIGRSRFRNFIGLDSSSLAVQTTTVIEEIVRAATDMSKTRTGALIVIERATKIGEIINTGIHLESSVSSELLINIFTPNTPLHDGAVVVRNNKIMAAACFLPLTDNQNLSKELGTRHRAAIGISEISDAIVVVVSEETGSISFALNGGLTRNLTPDILRKALNKNLLEKDTPAKKLSIWKVKTK
jgi:diadenylate cyclase